MSVPRKARIELRIVDMRDVRAMLIEAAMHSAGILANPDAEGWEKSLAKRRDAIVRRIIPQLTAILEQP